MTINNGTKPCCDNWDGFEWMVVNVIKETWEKFVKGMIFDSEKDNANWFMSQHKAQDKEIIDTNFRLRTLSVSYERKYPSFGFFIHLDWPSYNGLGIY